MIGTETVESVVAATHHTKDASSNGSTAAAAAEATQNTNRRSFLLAHAACLVISTSIVRSFWEFENASRALAFYGLYHRYGWNQLIHFFGVPGIVWSGFIFMVHVPLPIVGTTNGFLDNNKNNGKNDDDDASISYAGFLAICYNLFYLSIDPLGAVLYAPVIYIMYTSAKSIRQRDRARYNDTNNGAVHNSNNNCIPWYGTGRALKFALLVNVLCWYVQIHLGHKIIEGAQPAVLKSLGGALSVAPLFAFYEGLWMFGINKGLQESTLQLVNEYTQEICVERGVEAMKACRSLLLPS